MNTRKLNRSYPFWMTSPAIIIYTLFFIVPIFASFIYSFTNWNMNSINSPVFNGLDNFRNLFSDGVFFRSLSNTLLFAFTTTILKTVVGLSLAVIVVQKFIGNSFFRTLFYMPSVLSPMIVGLLFTAILKQEGLMNNILNSIGLGQLARDWLGNYGTAMFWIIAIEIWMWAGFSMFIFISGLQAISKDYYEAADMEGASAWLKFRSITLPLLAPSFTVVTTLNITGGLKVFDLVYSLTGGGPGFDTQVLNTYTYRAFGMGLLGKSSASVLILSFVVVLITFALNKMLKSREVDA
ncbi:MAG: sugar ABC transporter permease [Candidatus Pristimantibacillus lignocellulolyticus]|uniref:Sugar ABC transporter permease n=1 Tax=Candidatus Pristimantibacillus lignocellulolyticus TaxID=2994561 RepID=A0A9J6ZGV4_9BACL|nr:MAG: sugar ABC transporter permease [Candidatus Pristimantibacillus lignocellulolyticus]